MTRFLAHSLFFLAAWTLVVKFAFPIAWAVEEGTPAFGLVWWDFWWVVHIWLGWSLIARPAYTFWLALLTAVIEIVIVVTKFVLFFQQPEWTIWTTNWFINKVFVLALFVIMLAHIGLSPAEYARPVRAERGRGLGQES